MLILARRCGEGVLIGEGVRVVVTSVDGGVIRLGIEAPRDVVVIREELDDGAPLRHRGARASRGEAG